MLEQRSRPLTKQERIELELFYEFEPFGAKRDDLRFGLLLAMLYNGIFKPKGEPALAPEDFVLFDAELQSERRDRYDRVKAMVRKADIAMASAGSGVDASNRFRRGQHGGR